MTQKPKAFHDAEIQRLRENINDLRVKISLVLYDDPTGSQEIDDLKQQIDTSNQKIIERELAAKSGSPSHY